jgi:hypothetical protein
MWRTCHRNQRYRHEAKYWTPNRSTRSAAQIITSLETSIAVPVLVTFLNGANNVYATCDSLNPKGQPKLHVEKFLSNTITIPVSRILGTFQDTCSWMNYMEKVSPKTQQEDHNHAKMKETLVEVRTPNLGLGSATMTNAASSQAKDLPNLEISQLSDVDPFS